MYSGESSQSRSEGKIITKNRQQQLEFINETLKELDLSHIHPLLETTTKYAISTDGKRLRPLIAILCTEMLGGDYRDTRDMFLALELIHNATLVHDDIIDGDMYRRGEPSLFSEHGVKKAVLTGDALLSIGLMYASRTGKPEIVGWLAETALKMVQGITLQNQYKRKLMSVDEYLHMNYLKSGSLFEAASALGGITGSNDPEDVKKLAQFGKCFGNAYQIRDDIIDTFTPQDSENSPNNDLLNGDPSLLLLYAINSDSIDEDDKARFLSIYSGECKDLNVDRVRRVYEETGSLQKAIDKMQEFSNMAKEILDGYPESDAKESLYELLEQYNSSFTDNLYKVSSDMIQGH
ncbi:polyprenyl synthetase family protein [Candidatus Bathyarchaeota archaeon]|nr:polyprenyl synthetase family protein [Candidatus Bathyarchaeota archaeon]